eukprot:Phypoly_transcript_21976.p1 GENE.Phypoly_transcript_21976~~Phypoly_transcript_21976.p1  ORF type:complete len:115 (+),score=18.48 Phypoly_transcript_21976:216-560(+)
MGSSCSKRAKKVPIPEPTTTSPPVPNDIIVVQPDSDAHAMIYKSEVESRHREIRSMTEAKPVCSLYVENTFKPGFCRECKHPKIQHADPYAGILDDLADPEAEAEYAQDQAPQD